MKNQTISFKVPFFTLLSLVFFGISTSNVQAQTDQDIYSIIDQVSATRIEQDITSLVNFGTRHTLSDTLSNKTGIGAARRWIKKSFENTAANCGDCLEVFYQGNLVKKGTNGRIVKDVNIVNVVAIQRGTKTPINLLS